MDVRDAILNRWSAKKYDRNRPLSPEVVRLLLDSARRAPSSYNDQPWHLILGLNFDETHSRILETLSPYNRGWAKDAPMLAILVARVKYTFEDRINPAHQLDCGTFWGFLNVQASGMGIMCRGMGGFSPSLAREMFEIPEGYEPLMAFACGYPLEDPNQKPRRKIEEFVFAGRFGNPVVWEEE